MAVTIAQAPLYNVLPIGQQVIFAISQDTIVATKFKVKFIAEIHVSKTAINLSSSTDVIGTFKTTPNNKGVGIFDLRPILETFVSPDYLGSTFGNGSRYKTPTSPYQNYIPAHPMHLIDKYAVSENSIRFMAIQFKVEFSETATGSVNAPSNATNSIAYKMFNGVLQYDDVLTLGEIDGTGSLVAGSNYGYNLDSFYLNDVSTPGNFLSNAPTTQYARLTDYGTLPFFNFLPGGSADRVYKLRFRYYDSSGVLLGSESLSTSWSNGGYTNLAGSVVTRIMYSGAFPANLRGWSTAFQALVTADTIAYYTVQAENGADVAVSELYTINIICPNERGYEGIRLTWLNQWGTWDYYTFNKKSVRSITTNRTSYTQLGGTWNESKFKINGYKGGKKNFRVNSSERIKLTTGFVTEAEGIWFEELINSTEVYVLNGFDGDEVAPYTTITNKYVEPVVLTTSSYVKKTIANDKLMQYSIEIEKSKMQRTQSV
jgi:hypothetical protein